MSKNKKSLQQIALACKHFHEMRNVGVSENHAIRTLELFCDVYAKVVTDGTSIPHRPKKIPFLNWSNRALEARYENPDLKTQGNLVVEHGTPRREFARLVLKLYDSERLDENKLNNLVRTKWKVAVVTAEENAKLNQYLRTTRLSNPSARWELAGIEFGDAKLIAKLELKLASPR